jgi:O-antigen/teichoic acid export membrane protein
VSPPVGSRRTSGPVLTPPAPPVSLDSSLASGIVWTAGFRWSAQLVSWAATVYSARLITPSEFGLVSMAGLTIGLVRMAEGLGLDTVLVQDRGLVGRTEAQLAGFVLAMGVALAALLGGVAPFVARFFAEPRVAEIIRAMSLLVIFDAIQVVSRARLQRQLRFQQLAVSGFIQLATASLVLAATARAGFGAWALVVNVLAGALAVTILLFWWAPYRVAWPRDLAVLARPLLQGWRIFASRVAWYAYTNADQTIIGRGLGSGALGSYSFATSFSTLAQEEVGSIVSRVVPGIFSAVQGNVAELRRYFLLLTEFLTVLSFPVSFGLAATADLIIPLVLGPEWTPVIAPLRILCLYAAFLASQTLTSHILLWTGQFRVQMWCSVLSLVTMPLAMLVGVRFGLPGVAWTWALIFPLVNVPSLYFAFRTIGISTRDWLDAVKPAAAGCVIMIGTVAMVRALLPADLSLAARTTISILAGMLAYPAALRLLFNERMQRIILVGRTIRSEKPAVLVEMIAREEED